MRDTERRAVRSRAVLTKPKEQRVSRKREWSVTADAQENKENEATQLASAGRGERGISFIGVVGAKEPWRRFRRDRVSGDPPHRPSWKSRIAPTPLHSTRPPRLPSYLVSPLPVAEPASQSQWSLRVAWLGHFPGAGGQAGSRQGAVPQGKPGRLRPSSPPGRAAGADKH